MARWGRARRRHGIADARVRDLGGRSTRAAPRSTHDRTRWGLPASTSTRASTACRRAAAATTSTSSRRSTLIRTWAPAWKAPRWAALGALAASTISAGLRRDLPRPRGATFPRRYETTFRSGRTATPPAGLRRERRAGPDARRPLRSARGLPRGAPDLHLLRLHRHAGPRVRRRRRLARRRWRPPQRAPVVHRSHRAGPPRRSPLRPGARGLPARLRPPVAAALRPPTSGAGAPLYDARAGDRWQPRRLRPRLDARHVGLRAPPTGDSSGHAQHGAPVARRRVTPSGLRGGVRRAERRRLDGTRLPGGAGDAGRGHRVRSRPGEARRMPRRGGCSAAASASTFSADRDHCGACGRGCSAGETCSGGVCGSGGACSFPPRALRGGVRRPEHGHLPLRRVRRPLRRRAVVQRRRMPHADPPVPHRGRCAAPPASTPPPTRRIAGSAASAAPRARSAREARASRRRVPVAADALQRPLHRHQLRPAPLRPLRQRLRRRGDLCLRRLRLSRVPPPLRRAVRRRWHRPLPLRGRRRRLRHGPELLRRPLRQLRLAPRAAPARCPTPRGTGRRRGDSLLCFSTSSTPICTNVCENDASQAVERMACGGAGSTCLTQGDGPAASSLCAASCSVAAMTVAAGACRAGFVCTGWWHTHAGAADPTPPAATPGSQLDCSAGAVCATRARAPAEPRRPT